MNNKIDIRVISGIVNLDERKAKLTEENIKVLDTVKEILTLGNTDIMTVQMVADYYEVNLNTIEQLISRNKEELVENGLKDLTGKETRDKLVTYNLSVTNHRGYFECEGLKFANRRNTLINKRVLLNIGMLLRDSEVARELRRRILDIVYDASENNGSIEIVVNDIDEEIRLSQELGVAIMQGDMNKVIELNTRIFALKNKRISELETESNYKGEVIEGLAENISLQEKRQRINQIIRRTGSQYSEKWALLYSEFEKKYHMNLDRRIASCGVKVKNKLDYIDKVEHMIPELYELTVKLFESNVDKIVDEIKNVTNKKAL